MKALITGASGFVGPYLARHLRALGYEVYGGSTSGEGSPDYESVRLDVRRREEVEQAVKDVAPDEIYHLAAITRPSLGLVSEFYEVNLIGSINVLEAANQGGASVLLVGSAYVYGKHDEVIIEDSLLRPVNHYGVSKAAADLAAIGYALDGLRVVRARPFNHSGPGQSPDFVLPSLVSQFARIEAGLEAPVIKLGNLDSVRDFSDVRDVVRAYPLLLKQGQNGEAYNIASSQGVSVRELVGMLLEVTGMSVEIEVEGARVRPSDIPYLVGSAERLKRDTAWQAEYSLKRMLLDMLEDERARL
jgi:GDP-4-dehydro-6-deoxy-D-mannose reductase